MPKANADRGATQNHYEVLDVAPSASTEDIRTAYRALARKHHPDVNPSQASALRMAQINGAYQTLIDPNRRAFYDRELAAAEGTRRMSRVSIDEAVTTQRMFAPLRSRRNAVFAACLAGGIVAVGAARYLWLDATGRTDEFSLQPSVSPATDDVLLQSASSLDSTCVAQPLVCPAGSQHHAKLERDACLQWCSDARGNVVARSTGSVAQQPPAAADLEPPLRTQQFWDGQLACTYRFGLPNACSWRGSNIELGHVGASATNDWQVRKVEGAAPTTAGAACEVAIFPFEAESSLRLGPDSPPYNCRLAVRCGQLIYGAPQSGYCLCDVHQDQLRGVLDGRGVKQDGDPALALSVAKGQLSIVDARWRVLLERKKR